MVSHDDDGVLTNDGGDDDGDGAPHDGHGDLTLW